MRKFYLSTLTLSFCFTLIVNSIHNDLTQACPNNVAGQTQLVEMEPECFRKLYNTDLHDGHKIYKIINERLATYKRLLQDLKMSDVQHLRTHPVIKWAQNQSHIFLNMRLSHRHDSPTCSDIRSESFDSDVFFVSGDLNIKKLQPQQANQKENSNSQKIQQNDSTSSPVSSQNTSDHSATNIKSRFNLQCECYFTNQKLLFSLNLKFHSTLIRLNIKREGFGTYTLIGQKLVPEIWVSPFNDVKKAGIWTQIRNKYDKDMNKYFQLLQSSRQNNPSKVKKRYRNKTKKQEAELKLQNQQNVNRPESQQL